MPIYVDTHTHLYLDAFDEDRTQVVNLALENGVRQLLLPNVDAETLAPMLRLCDQFAGICMPMIGLHPTSVREDFEHVLQQMKPLLTRQDVVAIGETGIDLYWDTTYYLQQIDSFRLQIQWALEYDLPIVIHCRNSIDEIMQVLEPFEGKGLKGVMHCFPGNAHQADWFTRFGLMLGIGGVVTYKNSMMAKVVEHVDLNCLVLETDAPYLPPVPHRGKRNQPDYLLHVAARIAEIKGLSLKTVAMETTQNASRLFNLNLSETSL